MPQSRVHRGLSILILAAAAAGCAASQRLVPPVLEASEFRRFADRPSPQPQLVESWARHFVEGRFIASSGAAIPYRILQRGSGRRMPLVIVLHGSGAMGTDNRSQIGPFAAAWAQADIGEAIVLVPQVPSRSADYRAGSDGLPESFPGPSFGSLLEFIDRFASHPSVDPAKVHLVGFSMGASAALQAGLARRGRFASIVAFAPVPPPRSAAAAAAGEPLTMIHGDKDTENPFAADRAWVAALRHVGGHPKFIVYRDMDHRVPADLLTAADWRAALLRGSR